MLHSALPLQLAYRGHMREAYDIIGGEPSRLFPQFAQLGIVTPDSARQVFSRWLTTKRPEAHNALSWWSSVRDTASIKQLLNLYESNVAKADRNQRAMASYHVSSARAFLILARGDSAGATKAFAELPDTVCLRCDLDRIEAARLTARSGNLEGADRLLRQRLYSAITPIEIAIAFERAQLAARQKKADAGKATSGLVISAWQGGDPEVQGVVTAARKLLTSFGGLNSK